jgi:hypothetical protein
MRHFLLLVMVFISAGVWAESAPTQVAIAFGGSVPIDPSGHTFTEKEGPSRANGGEHIVIKFARTKTISDIKLTGYSSGHAGKSLIHNVIATNGTTKTSLDALFQFKKITTGNPQNYQNLVMLPDTTSVETAPNLSVTQIDFVIEGFTNNDASVLLQISSNDGLPVEDFMVTRTGDSETIGGLIDESKYAKFNTSDLQALISRGKTPAASELNGKTFICTNYSRLNATQVNVKARAYAVTNNVLMSTSDLQGAPKVWTTTNEGLQAVVDDVSGCGPFQSFNIVRMTSGGNLVSEVVIDLESYLTQCEKAGYDRNSMNGIETNETFPSIINSKYVVNSYEFCHL